jgi:hypothetical protein
VASSLLKASFKNAERIRRIRAWRREFQFVKNKKHCSLPILKFKKLMPTIGSLTLICMESFPRRKYFLLGEGRNVWLKFQKCVYYPCQIEDCAC